MGISARLRVYFENEGAGTCLRRDERTLKFRRSNLSRLVRDPYFHVLWSLDEQSTHYLDLLQAHPSP